MKAGERQVAPALDGIRRDHVARYEFAAARIAPGSRVLDIACGVGYGAHILACAGNRVRGIDKDEEAIAYAQKHWPHARASWQVDDAAAPGAYGDFDAAVCFETIEHIEDPRPLLKALRLAAPLLIASVPNEDVTPWEQAPGIGTAFHFRHYTRRAFQQLLQECGWVVGEWHGQAGPESEVEPNMNGRTLIAVAHREALPDEVDEGEPKGKHIAILGLGPSLDQYLEITKRLGGRSKFCDEVWGINALGDVFACDLIFHMDDIRIQEIRAQAAPESNIAAMVAWLKRPQCPVVTSRPHPEYPALFAFPLEDVLNHFGHDYFNSTAAYAIAFAIHVGATKISLFGMDYTYPNAHDAEKGRGCVEFWLGQAHARGVKISLPKTTTLMDAMYPRAQRLYGYDTLTVQFNMQEDGQLKLEYIPRETLPTAEEIEARYDHSAHPNALVEKE